MARIPALDGLRALAILLVIPHNSDRFGMAHDWTRWVAFITHGGWIGVQLFFVLSGFLITRGLLETVGEPRYYRAFFQRRTLRIFPLYFLTLVLFLIVLPAIVTLPADVFASYRLQGPLWFFLSNWAQPYSAAVYWFPHFWSLAVEEQFYLVWPFVIIAAGARRMLAVCVVMAVAAIGLRAATMAAGMPGGVQYFWTVCRMDALALGAAVAVVLRSDASLAWLRQRGATVVLGGIGILLATGAVTRGLTADSIGMRLVGFTAVAAGFAALVAALVAGGSSPVVRHLGQFLSLPVWRSVARVSYGMYVLHLPITLLTYPWVYPALQPFGTAAPVLFCLIVVAASYVAGWLSYQLLEKHCLRARLPLIPVAGGAA